MSVVLITGCAGLIGRHLRATLEGRGCQVRGLDLLASGTECGDVRDRVAVESALDGVDGVVHLAAISRVVQAERDPALCWSTNVDGLHNVIACVQRQPKPPWVISASSREVYGQQERFPVAEDVPLRPVNAYGRSKLAGEHLVTQAQLGGLRAAIVRFSNVYGCTKDHEDRVVPAFARATVLGSALRVDGLMHSFDFTHVTDTARGMASLVELLQRGEAVPPPIHFVTGKPTTLAALARLAMGLGDGRSVIDEAPPRANDVSAFHGCGARAMQVLDWSPRIGIEEGLAALVRDFRAEFDHIRQKGGIS